MNLASIALGVLALVLTFGGIVATPIPVLGTVLSFLAPVAALAGLILGGVAASRARSMGDSDGLAVGGIVTSAVALLPALLVALTCGVCNTLCSGAMLRGPDRAGARVVWPPDAAAAWPGDAGAPATLPTSPGLPLAPPGEAPPPAFPPPPFDPPTTPTEGPPPASPVPPAAP